MRQYIATVELSFAVVLSVGVEVEDVHTLRTEAIKKALAMFEDKMVGAADIEGVEIVDIEEAEFAAETPAGRPS